MPGSWCTQGVSNDLFVSAVKPMLSLVLEYALGSSCEVPTNSFVKKDDRKRPPVIPRCISKKNSV